MEAHRAALMPQLSLSGSIGLQSVEADGLFDVKQWFANLAGNLFRPLFDGDRLGSQVELAEARFDELAAAYGRVVVTAVNEVEAALIHFENGRRRHESLTAEHADAEAARDLHTARYESGVGGYADLLDATRALLDAESALAQSERNLALARLAIHRALGGAWTPLATEDTSRRRRFRPMRQIKAYILAGALLIGAIAIAALLVSLRPEPPRNDPPPRIPFASTAPAVGSTGAIPVFGSGTVKPRAEVDVAAGVSGRVVWVDPAFKSGGRVREGQALFRGG